MPWNFDIKYTLAEIKAHLEDLLGLELESFNGHSDCTAFAILAPTGINIAYVEFWDKHNNGCWEIEATSLNKSTVDALIKKLYYIP